MVGHGARKRVGPDDVAELLAFCAGDKTSYLTGVEIRCDGAVLAVIRLQDMMAVACGA
ncbi:hypothetical protein SKC41_07170 [Mycobacterium sp. 050128]|uniref:hypothetical protein n=1 Tax=Mycobacterium sp. 050128 TaxID=3096112 RepID=UPI002EDA62E4